MPTTLGSRRPGEPGIPTASTRSAGPLVVQDSTAFCVKPIAVQLFIQLSLGKKCPATSDNEPLEDGITYSSRYRREAASSFCAEALNTAHGSLEMCTARNNTASTDAPNFLRHNKT